MANINGKPIRERGIIISKTINEAREAGQSNDGSIKWNAREKEFLLEIISCDQEDFSTDTGILNGTLLKYKVDEATYNKAKFGMWADVKFVVTDFNKEMRFRAESCVLVDPKKQTA